MTTASVDTQLNAAAVGGSQQRGIASLTWGGRVFRFRTNPNEITWNYSLITHTDQTYGGRVVQILGTKIDDLTVKVDCGNGGWEYLMKVVTYIRDLMVSQRNGQPATFEYTTRNWKLNVYAVSIPFADQVSATTRELTLNFKVQQDVTGTLSTTTISAAIQALTAGIGWSRSQYNSFDRLPSNNGQGMMPNITDFAGGAAILAGSATMTPVDLGGLSSVVPGAGSLTNALTFFTGPK
jgi:hypothetical protein